MQNYAIGVSGLDAAQRALDIVGNNITNAATEGYHRQRINLVPAYSSQVGDIVLGGGVDITGITRMIDDLLEQEILRQQSSLGQTSRELSTLQTVESAFGELSAAGSLGTTIDEFFGALQDLCSHPTESIYQQQAVTAAQTMAGQFRTLGEFLTRQESQIALEAGNVVGRVNTLINQIAELNDKIERMEISGAQSNNLRDQRDQCITELSKLVGIETYDREYGVVDVAVAGIPVVMGNCATELEAGLDQEGKLGITVAGAYNYYTNVQGGELSALLSLKNDILVGIHSGLDTLADAIIQQINRYHFQGVGSAGSFTELTGWRMPSENLADFEPPLTDGSIYVRVINTSTGKITRHKIEVDVSSDSLTTIAEKISTTITGLTASVVSSKLHILADAGYEFDFLPAVLSEPTASNLTGTSPPAISVSGIYTGTENQTFRFRVIGTGSVGNDTLQLEVKDSYDQVIATLNIGAGYAAGDKLDVGNGIKISVGTGDVVDGDSFDVDVFADTDTSGLLAAAGMNTFFSGHSAAGMEVCSDIVSSPSRVATAVGADMVDNANAVRMAGLKDQAVSSLNAMTTPEFFRRLVTDIGQQASIKQMGQDNVEAMVQNLTNQQSEISSVDVNEEAAQMLVFQQMFQAVAKYLNAVKLSIDTLIEMF
jgi:flagellar hook-associated protein 1 FlgK